MTKPGGDEATGRQPKVARLIDKYEMENIGDELEQYWTAESENRKSLRDLTDYFNKEMLSQVLSEAGIQTLEREHENIYRLLTSEDVSGAERSRTRRRLERNGIDVDAYLADTVSYQAIRTYLKEHRNADYTDSNSDPRTAAARSIRRMRGRTASVTNSKLKDLRSAGHIASESFRVLIDTTVICEECGKQYEAGTFVEQGGCGCSSEE